MHTEAERAYVAGMAHPARHVAVRVAAKEAAYKAFQSLPAARPVSWHELETERNIEGRPSLRLHGLAAELAALHGPLTVHLSRTSQFTDSRRAVVQAARSLFRSDSAKTLAEKVQAVPASYEVFAPVVK